MGQAGAGGIAAGRRRTTGGRGRQHARRAAHNIAMIRQGRMRSMDHRQSPSPSIGVPGATGSGHLIVPAPLGELFDSPGNTQASNSLAPLATDGHGSALPARDALAHGSSGVTLLARPKHSDPLDRALYLGDRRRHPRRLAAVPALVVGYHATQLGPLAARVSSRGMVPPRCKLPPV